MSLAKAVPDGLKDRECEKTALRKRPPIPYVPEKDCVQETVSAYKDNHLKTQIGKGMELRVPIWHSGTRKAFLIHVRSAQEAIKKKGYFKAYKENNKAYVELCGKIKSAKAQLATLDKSAIGEAGTSKKSKKTQEAAAANDQVAPVLRRCVGGLLAPHSSLGKSFDVPRAPWPVDWIIRRTAVAALPLLVGGGVHTRPPPPTVS